MLSVKIGQYHPSLEDSFVNTIQTLKKDDPLAPILVVAPTRWMLNRLQVRLMLRQDASPGSMDREMCYMNISFMNFYTLSNEICRRSGMDIGQIIRRPVVYECLIAGLLKRYPLPESVFKDVQYIPALARSLYQVIQDLADAGVDAGNLREVIKEGFIEGAEIQKLTGVVPLYEQFRQQLKGLNISWDADVFHLAGSCVQDSVFLKGVKCILAYGFYDLTGAEQDFFREIFRSCPSILFMPYQRKHHAFIYVKPFFESFVLGLAHDVEELPPVTGFSCLMNSQFEDNARVPEFQEEIRNPKSETCGEQSRTIQNPDNTQYLANVHIINASGRRDEVWAVAKEILKLSESGCKMDEIGVVARSLEPYTDDISRIFGENYIPFTTSTQESLGKYPLVNVIRQILMLKREDYYRPMVMELLSSPYFNIPALGFKGLVPRPDLWDALSRRLGIRGDIERWLSRLALARNASEEPTAMGNEAYKLQEVIKKNENTSPYCEKGSGREECLFSHSEEADGHFSIPVGQIELLENTLRMLSNDISALPERASWTVMGQKIDDLLQKYIHIPPEGTNPEDRKRDRLIINKICELLTTLRTVDCLSEEVTPDQFADTFIEACREEGIPSGLENGRGVKVLDAMSARGIPFRVLFVLGLNEKVFPRAISEEPFLRDHIRRRLSEVMGNCIPEKLRGFDEERLLFCLLLNAARERLYLLYERSDEAGKPRIPSHYLMDIVQSVKHTSVTGKGHREKLKCDVYIPRGIKDKLLTKEIPLLTPKEVGIRMSLDGIDPVHYVEATGVNPEFFARLQSALRLAESYQSQLTAFDGVVGDISKWWNEKLCRGISPTALEVFGLCPFKFFMGTVLELESLQEPEKIEVIAGVDLGSLYHCILRDFYAHLIREGYFGFRAKKMDFTEMLHGIARKYFTDIEHRISIQYPILWELKKEEMLAFLTRFIHYDLERIRQTGYVPAFLERTVRLCLRDTLPKFPPPPDIKQGDASKIIFKGKIDRIDIKVVHDMAMFRVVDYKSGRFYKENLVRSAVRGQKLQLPLYIIMAEYLLSEEIKKGRIPVVPARLEEAAFVYIAQDVEDKKGQDVIPAKVIGVDDWEDVRKQWWETLKVFLQYIHEGIFPISPAEDTQRCEWCEFASACRRGHQPLWFRLEHDARLIKYREIINLNIIKK